MKHTRGTLRMVLSERVTPEGSCFFEIALARGVEEKILFTSCMCTERESARKGEIALTDYVIVGGISQGIVSLANIILPRLPI